MLKQKKIAHPLKNGFVMYKQTATKKSKKSWSTLDLPEKKIQLKFFETQACDLLKHNFKLISIFNKFWRQLVKTKNCKH